MRRMAFVMVEFALAGVLALLPHPTWTGRWRAFRRDGCPGHQIEHSLPAPRV
jgi:hypothetical protein